MPEFLGKKVTRGKAAAVVLTGLGLGVGTGLVSNSVSSYERPAPIVGSLSPQKAEASTTTVPESTTTININDAAKIAERQLGTTTTTEAPKTSSTSVVKAPPTTAEVRVGDPADPNNSGGSVERDGPVDRESVLRAADEFKNMIIDDVTNKRGTDGGSHNLDQTDEQTGDRTVLFVSNFTNEDGTTGFYQNRVVIHHDGDANVTVSAYLGGGEQSGDDPILAAQLSLSGGNASYVGQSGVGRKLDTNASFTAGYANGRALADAARAGQPLQSVALQPIA